MQYVADIQAVLHGSLTPHQILWDLSYSRGLQLQIDFAFQKGKYCVPA